MSVAFRRESDDEHLEPKFEIPIPLGPNFVTARGLAQIQAKVTEIEALLPEVTDETETKAVRRKLRYWRTRQATAQRVDADDDSQVAFGCVVSYELNGKERTITIVGDDEADPTEGLLSFTAPICRAMMDAAVGECVDFAGKSDAIEIIAITPITPIAAETVGD